MNSDDLRTLDIRAIDSILSIKSSSGDLLQKLVHLYQEESPQLISEIAEGIDNSDVGQIHASSHSLKSTSAALGATQLAEFAREIERMARDSDITNALDILHQIQSEHEKVMDKLEALISDS